MKTINKINAVISSDFILTVGVNQFEIIAENEAGIVLNNPELTVIKTVRHCDNQDILNETAVHSYENSDTLIIAILYTSLDENKAIEQIKNDICNFLRSKIEPYKMLIKNLSVK